MRVLVVIQDGGQWKSRVGLLAASQVDNLIASSRYSQRTVNSFDNPLWTGPECGPLTVFQSQLSHSVTKIFHMRATKLHKCA